MAKIKLKRKKAKVTYSGSLIQQNFGETLEKHGFLVWDLDTMTYAEVDIPNDYGYYTMDVDNGVVPDVTDMPKYARLRVRISNTDVADTKKVITQIKMKYGVDDFVVIKKDSFGKLKTGNRLNKLDFEDISDITYQNSLIKDYIYRMLPFSDEDDLKLLEEVNTDINNRINQEEIHRNIFWKPVKFQFSNMFSYGDNNTINFEKIGGLVGLFAPNASGKSSLFDAISFCLYDKCSRAFKAQNIMNNRKTSFFCQLDFVINGVDYHIRREAKVVSKGKNVKVDVNFWKTEDGIDTSLNGTERRDTDAVIEKYVGKYEDFVLTALSLQGNNALFIDKSQSERKDLLAQFMGLNIFDKLYETASEDIKEVSVLIKNFKKTDFTSELAESKVKLMTKKSELKELEKLIKTKITNRDELLNRIFDLGKELIPIDGNFDIDLLEQKKTDSETRIKELQNDKITKASKIEQYTNLLSEISQSIQEKKTINGKPIEIAKSEWDDYKTKITDTEHQIELLEQSLKANNEKLTHLEEHEYDPNCPFCMNNVFVKDAIATKEIVQKQTALKDKYILEHSTLIRQAGLLADVEEQWDELTELKTKYQKGIVIKEKADVELKGLDTKEELLNHQLATIVADIEKYHSNEDTIKRNKQIETSIAELTKLKDEVDASITITSKDITTISTSISALETFLEGVKEKMKEIKELEEKNRLYTYYLDAVKRDGVPYELISKAMPIIENEINNILGQVVDFNIVMDLDGKSINAKIVYEDQEWPLEMCSGMEKFISGLAIRVALINICNLPRPNFLVIDEGFGTLDATNLSSLFMMMQYLKTQFDFIWMISHLDQMRDIADQLIEIKKIDGFSKINF